MSELSDKLKQLRGASSQAEMARQLGMKQPQWARYESGVSSPSIELLTKICRVHACSADWLLGLEDRATTSPNVIGDNNAVAVGAHAIAKTFTHHATADCKTCPYKKWGEKLRKQGLVIPGV